MAKLCAVCRVPLKRIGVKFVHVDGTTKCIATRPPSYANLKAQRDELLEALENLCLHAKRYMAGSAWRCADEDFARAESVIAKVKGGK